MKVKSESEVALSCLTLSDPMDCSLPGSSMGFSRQEYWRGVPLPLDDIKSLRSCYSPLGVNISLDDALTEYH